MQAGRRERCGRCGADPFAAGEPYTSWIWITTDGDVEEHALRLCVPCGREFPSNRACDEYLRLGFYG